MLDSYQNAVVDVADVSVAKAYGPAMLVRSFLACFGPFSGLI
jgi:hypothetical protein